MTDYELNIIKLKIKAKHLTAESRIIRKEENKLSGWRKRQIQDHRRWDVRNEARATQLTLAFLLGKEYRKVELKTRDHFDWKHEIVLKKIIAMAKKYGGSKEEDVRAWFKPHM